MLLVEKLVKRVGSQHDQLYHGAYTHLSRDLKAAEKFVFDLDLSIAAMDVAKTKPSTLLAALPMSRPPFKTVWLEWPEKAMRVALGHQIFGDADSPTPDRCGCLIQEVKDKEWMCTVAWEHRTLNETIIGGIGFRFNLVGGMFQLMHQYGMASQELVNDPKYGMQEFKLFIPEHIPTIDEIRINTFNTFSGEFPKAEVDALVTLLDHFTPMLAPCMHKLVTNIVARINKGELPKKTVVEIVEGWKQDLEGMPALIRAFLLMLNSRNAVELVAVPQKRRSATRIKQQKVSSCSHTIVRVNLSRQQKRRAEMPAERNSPRMHLVRGHFKVRKSGVYWWNSFVKGNPNLGTVHHQHYDVKK